MGTNCQKQTKKKYNSNSNEIKNCNNTKKNYEKELEIFLKNQKSQNIKFLSPKKKNLTDPDIFYEINNSQNFVQETQELQNIIKINENLTKFKTFSNAKFFKKCLNNNEFSDEIFREKKQKKYQWNPPFQIPKERVSFKNLFEEEEKFLNKKQVVFPENKENFQPISIEKQNFFSPIVKKIETKKKNYKENKNLKKKFFTRSCNCSINNDVDHIFIRVKDLIKDVNIKKRKKILVKTNSQTKLTNLKKSNSKNNKYYNLFSYSLSNKNKKIIQNKQNKKNKISNLYYPFNKKPSEPKRKDQINISNLIVKGTKNLATPLKQNINNYKPEILGLSTKQYFLNNNSDNSNNFGDNSQNSDSLNNSYYTYTTPKKIGKFSFQNNKN